MARRILLIIIAAILLLVTVAPLMVPVPPLDDTVAPEALADMDSRFSQVNNLQVHYKTAGQGEPVFILLHGFGANIYTWHEVMPELAKYGTVIAYDRPAFGLTERPQSWRGDNPYSPAAQVDLAIGLMDTLGIKDAILIGNSAGGKVAFDTALAYPDRVRALVAVDAAVYAGGGAPSWARPLLRTPQMRRIGPLIVRRIQSSGEELIRTAWHNPSKIDAETWAAYRKPLRAENWDRALWELTAASTESDLAERLSQLRLPVLVITGDDDRIVPTEDSLRLAEELPNAELRVLANCGHLPQEECPEAFMGAVANFIQGIE